MKMIRTVAMGLLLFTSACSTSSSIDYGSLPEVLPESEGELLYKESRCPDCHGYQGEGNGFLSEGLSSSLPDFSDPDAMKKISAERMKNAISQGTGAMPGYPQFSSRQVDQLVQYIQSLSSGDGS